MPPNEICRCKCKNDSKRIILKYLDHTVKPIYLGLYKCFHKTNTIAGKGMYLHMENDILESSVLKIFFQGTMEN